MSERLLKTSRLVELSRGVSGGGKAHRRPMTNASAFQPWAERIGLLLVASSEMQISVLLFERPLSLE